VTHDPEFESWARHAWQGSGGIDPRRPMKKTRRDLVIEVYDEAGRVATRYQVFRCWVSAFRGPAHFEASVNAVAIESMKIENEGWEWEKVNG
jgi:phage tail-like protein